MASPAAPGPSEPIPSFLEARLQLARLGAGGAERLGRVLEHATRLSAEQLNIERVGIWLFDPEHTTLTQFLLYQRSSHSHSYPGTQIPTSSMPSYFEELAKQRVLVIDDALSYPPMVPILEDYLRPHGIGSLLDASIFRQGRLFGIVCHEHVGATRKWSQHEIEFTASVADMVALYFEEAEAAQAQKRLMMQENELLQAERLASVGILARHVAHDLNNAVAPILMCAAQLRTALANDARLLERVQIILDAAEHGHALARKLLNAAAGGPLVAREATDLDAMLLDSVSLLKAVAGADVELVLEAAAEGATIEADPVELMRAVINLVTNARDAMPHGGRLTIRTKASHEGLRFEVSDVGLGMTQDEQGRLFQPFFTTKPGRGSGLGLAGVRNMIEAMRGRVEVISAPNQGTTIAITFPIFVAKRR